MKLPMGSMPAVISESVAAVLRVHGLALSPELLREIANNTTQAMFSIDINPENWGADFRVTDAAAPSPSDLLAVGETLRALAAAGRPNADTAPTLARVGAWLAELAKAAIASKAA